MVLVFVLAALLIVAVVGASRPAAPRSGVSRREKHDELDDLVMLDVASDGELDGDLDPSDDR